MKTISRKFAVAAAALALAVGGSQAPAGAYIHGQSPYETNIDFTNGSLTVSWSGSAGKPTMYTLYVYHSGPTLISGTTAGFPGGVKYSYAVGSGWTCPTGGYYRIDIKNKFGSSVGRYDCDTSTFSHGY